MLLTFFTHACGHTPNITSFGKLKRVYAKYFTKNSKEWIFHPVQPFRKHGTRNEKKFAGMLNQTTIHSWIVSLHSGFFYIRLLRFLQLTTFTISQVDVNNEYLSTYSCILQHPCNSHATITKIANSQFISNSVFFLFQVVTWKNKLMD